MGPRPVPPGGALEPTVLLTALAGATSRIGLIATASTSYNHPYNLARRFASLDHVSGGRAGWNIVTTATQAAAQNFGLDDNPAHAERYRRVYGAASADHFARRETEHRAILDAAAAGDADAVADAIAVHYVRTARLVSASLDPDHRLERLRTTVASVAPGAEAAFD